MSLLREPEEYKALESLSKEPLFSYITKALERKKGEILRNLTHVKDISDSSTHYLRGQVFSIEEFLEDIEKVSKK